jgi:hypothetical protein
MMWEKASMGYFKALTPHLTLTKYGSGIPATIS